MKTLFYFKNSNATSFEVFAENVKEAKEIINKLTEDAIKDPLVLLLATQNYQCPKCSCGSSECNYPN